MSEYDEVHSYNKHLSPHTSLASAPWSLSSSSLWSRLAHPYVHVEHPFKRHTPPFPPPCERGERGLASPTTPMGLATFLSKAMGAATITTTCPLCD